jgi:hypothetical protein
VDGVIADGGRVEKALHIYDDDDIERQTSSLAVVFIVVVLRNSRELVALRCRRRTTEK